MKKQSDTKTITADVLLQGIFHHIKPNAVSAKKA